MIAGILAVLGAALTVGVLFLDLFPLNEFRDWIAIELSGERAGKHLGQILLREKLFSRDVSILYSMAVGELAGTSIRGLNFLVLLPLLATCVALFALGRQIGLPRFASLVAAWLWAFSLPVVDAA
ncbi:MAG: hypothetical protein MI919_36690, partial [Holophagales bacterium]|nr:hypothetical protein [Holophagales bacterium]